MGKVLETLSPVLIERGATPLCTNPSVSALICYFSKLLAGSVYFSTFPHFVAGFYLIFFIILADVARSWGREVL